LAQGVPNFFLIFLLARPKVLDSEAINDLYGVEHTRVDPASAMKTYSLKEYTKTMLAIEYILLY